MSDWLLQGVDPRTLDGQRVLPPHGRRMVRHRRRRRPTRCPDCFPLQDDNPLGWLEDRDCLTLADHLDYSCLDSGIAAEFLKENAASSRRRQDLTLDNLRTCFSSFLKSSTGASTTSAGSYAEAAAASSPTAPDLIVLF